MGGRNRYCVQGKASVRRRLIQMRLIRVFLSAYIGLLISFLFVFFMGNGSLKQYGLLLDYKTRLEANIDEMERINRDLRQEFRYLGTDPEKVRLLARKLSYFKPDEWVVRVAGFPRDGSYYEIGRILRRDHHAASGHLFAKILGLLIPILFYVISGLVTKSSGR